MRQNWQNEKEKQKHTTEVGNCTPLLWVADGFRWTKQPARVTEKVSMINKWPTSTHDTAHNGWRVYDLFKHIWTICQNQHMLGHRENSEILKDLNHINYVLSLQYIMPVIINKLENFPVFGNWETHLNWHLDKRWNHNRNQKIFLTDW